MTPELRARVAEYGASHRTPVNRLLHVLGIPLLGVGSLGLFCQLAVPVGAGVSALEPNAGQVALLVALGWYLYFGGRSALLAFGFVVVCYVVGSVLSAWVLAGLWLAGAAAHFVGHFGFEGKPPATFRDPRSILEAPVWLLGLLTGTLPREEVR
ncbi:MAG TPA: Mpo1-like protein [Fimbriiglobus sp.]|nr:Mpo1-like protein [Fimbriiglobus sp.]